MARKKRVSQTTADAAGKLTTREADHASDLDAAPDPRDDDDDEGELDVGGDETIPGEDDLGGEGEVKMTHPAPKSQAEWAALIELLCREKKVITEEVKQAAGELKQARSKLRQKDLELTAAIEGRAQLRMERAFDAARPSERRSRADADVEASDLARGTLAGPLASLSAMRAGAASAGVDVGAGSGLRAVPPASSPTAGKKSRLPGFGGGR